MSDLLAKDRRTAEAAAGESLSLSDDQAKALLGELGPQEDVRAVYHNGWGWAVLTKNDLVLLRGLVRPRAIRVPAPLRISRRTYGMFRSVEVLVHGHPHKLWGSKLDPRGELLVATGEVLPPDSPLRPGRGTRFATWISRHPVFVSVAVIGFLFANLGPAPARRRPWSRSPSPLWPFPTSRGPLAIAAVSARASVEDGVGSRRLLRPAAGEHHHERLAGLLPEPGP
ncbi:hypothetical protein ACR6C2_39870 [Streptomyces sp. INA 01156]